MILRKILVPKRQDVTENRRRLYSEEFHYCYPSPDINLVMKSRKMRWVGNVVCMERGKVHTGF
jgi:hypothetical protein